MRTAARIALAGVLALGLTGCGDEALWTRWRAERARWSADRELQRIELNPSLATVRDLERAEAALERVMRVAPLERWTAPGAPGDPRVAREVARISARAMIRRAELDLMRARRPEGIAGLERAFDRARGLPEVAREAAHSCAVALDQAGRDDQALAWWTRLASEFEPYEPATGGPVEQVLEAARVAARRLTLRKDAPAAAAVLATVERKLSSSLTSPRPGGEAASEMAWRELGVLRTLQGDPTGAMQALRAAMSSARSEDTRATLILDLGRAGLAAGWPDTARVYAAWASESGGEANRQSLRITARAWEIADVPDSALATWARLIEEYPKAQDSAAESRYRRGLLLEGLGRWEVARSEYRALAAAFPSHPLSFDAQLRIVQHHVREHEQDLARHESERLVKAMDYLIATQHDDAVQRAARRTRGEALLAVGDNARAFEALSDVWRRWPSTPSGIEAAWKAAEVAAGPLKDRAASDSLLSEIAMAAPDPEERVRARERLRRLPD